MRNVLAAAFLAMLLGVATVSLQLGATGNDTVDATTTGAMGQPAGVVVHDPKGSPPFRKALERLDNDDPVGAYAMASSLPDPAERRTVQWAAVYFHPGKIGHEAVAQLRADAPDFAPDSLFQNRLEQSLRREGIAGDDLVSVLGAAAPVTIDSQIALAAARLEAGDRDQAGALARQVWIDNFLTQEQEALVLGKLGALLDQEAHWQRAMHLMMHDRARGSERLLPFLSEAQRSLVTARAAVSRNAPDAKTLLDGVDPSLQSNPVFVFSRVQRARQFKLWDSAVDWLNKAEGELPDAAEWWYERRTLIRQLLDHGLPELAYRAAAGYTHGPEGRLVEARFHAGWIALSFLGDAPAAKAHFTEMAALATLPDTITQARYWLGRSNLKLEDMAAARAAFEQAAKHPTVYYGQLARAELGEAAVGLRPLPDWQQSEALFEANPVVRGIRLLVANGEKDMALPLLHHFGTTRSNGGEFLLAARLADELGAHNLSISIATIADQKGIALDALNFPQDGVPKTATLAADRAAVFAVVRQESMFQVDAVSPVGARGLMQLMPGTAKEVARTVGVDYSPERLVTDAAYNTLLGSTYLGDQLERFDGSLVLAAAAYNAGPGNARKWIKAYGDPRLGGVDPVVWVELIPFSETRTYVKRVLGNYLVYRERLGNSPMTLQQALRSID